MYKLLLVLCLVPGLVLAQLSGIVTDKNTREPLIGATVYLRELKKGAVTDVNGRYQLGNLPAGIQPVIRLFSGKLRLAAIAAASILPSKPIQSSFRKLW